MIFDFTTPAPKPHDLESAYLLIAALWISCAELAAKLTAQEEKLNTNPTNSSLPPSTDIFGKHKKKPKIHKRKSGLKQGAQVGHVGKGRKLMPNEDVDATIVCLPKTTCDCGGHIQANTSRFKRHQVFELPKIQPIVTEYQQVYGACTQCLTYHFGPLPEGVPKGMLGVRALSAAAILTGDYHLSKRYTQLLFSDFFNLPISVGTVSNAEAIVSEALTLPVEEAKEHVKTDPCVNADETGHKQKGQKMWMWLAATVFVAVFVIRRSRGSKVAKELLGEFFSGTLTTDRYSGYTWVDIAHRQFCWAHLIRDFIKISERSGEAGRIGDQQLVYIKRMFRLWWKFRDGTLSRAQFITAMVPLRRQMEMLLEQGVRCGESKTANTCKKLLKYKTALWTFIETEGVQPTNNFAEQLIRSYVLWRKSSFGTQSDRGDLFVERMMTVTATCKLQNRNRYDYINSAVDAHLRNKPVPSILYQEESTVPDKIAA
ncbi:MAG: IS66 family transposase [Methylococcaceae bacterium]